jgi:WD40 repeat protein/serine/threonine protein kinase
MDELVGQSIRGYELHEQIGEGGFGAVYRATQTIVGREVVIKIILPHFANQPEFIKRFEAEAQLVARLENIHIVPLYDYWRDPSGAYLVMRYLRGGTLRNSLEKGPWSVKATARLLNQVAAALTISHRNSVIHRDVKPSNILLDNEKNAYLTDFGIATQQIDGNKSGSQSGRVSGSAGYISPEQINLQPISPRTDMYSMGIILYEMLMGQHPYAGAKSAVALFIKHANEPLPAMEGIPETLQKVVQKATAKNPDERYTDMLELANAFRAAAHQSDFVGLVKDGEEVQEFDSSSFDLTPTSSVAVAVNPYKGLRAFQESDANDFFGRENLTKLLLARLDEDHDMYRFLAVVGPSGSGKSSVVKAGVVPALRRGELQNSENWFIVEMLPGISPFDELNEAMSSIATSAIPDLKTHLKDPKNGGLNAIVKRILPIRNSELMIVIDQFEEVFTQVDDYERTLFLDAIQQAVTTSDSRVRVIVTMRADFYDRPLLVQNFSQLMQQRTEVVIPLTVDELERTITAPARQVKVFFQQGLAATIVSEVNEQPGMLPMLQYALTELFERREGSLLTTKAYQDIGGVLGALARRAEEIYSQLNQDKQEVSRQLFLRLVTLGEGTEDTRRRALQSELYAATPNPQMMLEVIQNYGTYRLLTYDRDPITRTPTVEVAHEALIREWQRLREWLDSSRADIRLQRMLASASKEWRENKQDTSFLLRGGRLVQFEDWMRTSTINISQDERDYLMASIQERARQEKLEQEREEKERQQDLRNRRISRILAFGGATAAIVMAILALFAVRLGIDASNAANEANLARVEAVSAQNEALNQAATATFAQGDALNQAATATIAQGDAQNQAATATNALGEAQNQAATATNALGEAQNQAATATNALGEAQNQANANATAQQQAVNQANIAATAQADAQREAQASQSLALAAYAGQVQNSNSALALALALEANNIPNPSLQAQQALLSVVYSAPRQFLNNQKGINDIVIASDDNRLFVANVDGTVSVWDVDQRQVIQTFSGGHTQPILNIELNADNSILATASADNTVILWDVETGAQLRTLLGHTGAINGISFSPNGASLVSGSTDSTAIIWNVADGTARRTLTSDSRNAVRSVNYSPDGRYILVIADDAMRLWDNSSNTFLEFAGSPSRIRGGVFSPDGTQILISGSTQDSTPQLWDVNRRTLLPITFTAHSAPVNNVTFSPDGNSVLSSSDDFSLILSDASSGTLVGRLAAHNNRVTDGTFSNDGRYIFSVSSSGEIYEWDILQSSDRQDFVNPNTQQSTSLSDAIYSPNGSQVIASLDNGNLVVWDAESREVVSDFRFDRPRTNETHIVLSPESTEDNLIVAWGSTNLSLINLSDGAILRTLTDENDDAFVKSIDFNTDGSRVLWGGGFFFRETLPDFTRAGIMTIWDTQTGEFIQRFDVNTLDEEGNLIEGVNRAITAVAFTPDGRFVLSGGEDGSITLWDVESGEPIRQFTGHADIITQILLNREGTQVLTSSLDRAAILWNFEDGQLLRRFTGHLGGVNGVDFNSNETAIVTGANDSRIFIWDIETGQALQRFTGSDSPIMSVQFSTDNQQLLSSSLNGNTSVWRIETAEELQVWARENRYIPEFTCTQRVQFGLPQCDINGNPPPTG